jgi:hypothetical protein
MKNLNDYINESIVDESISEKFERIKTQIFKKLGSKYITDAGTIIVTKWWSNSYDYVAPDNNLDFEKKYNDIVGRIVEVLKKITGIKNPKEGLFHTYSAGTYLFNTGISDKDELNKLWDEIKTKVNDVCGNEVNSIKETETVRRASKVRNDIKELNIEMMPEMHSYTYAAVELYVEDSLY